jgi:hypothetical protein
MCGLVLTDIACASLAGAASVGGGTGRCQRPAEELTMRRATT